MTETTTTTTNAKATFKEGIEITVNGKMHGSFDELQDIVRHLSMLREYTIASAFADANADDFVNESDILALMSEWEGMRDGSIGIAYANCLKYLNGEFYSCYLIAVYEREDRPFILRALSRLAKHCAEVRIPECPVRLDICNYRMEELAK